MEPLPGHTLLEVHLVVQGIPMEPHLNPTRLLEDYSRKLWDYFETAWEYLETTWTLQEDCSGITWELSNLLGAT